MSRYKAFALHLCLSILIVGSFLAAVLLIWYPPELLAFTFPMRLVVTLAAVDVVAGPLLTLLVFRVGKPGLRFDLTCIALVQAAFLVYGMHTAWTTRPVWLVASAGQIDVVFANEVSDRELERSALPEFSRLPLGPAKLVGARLPEDPEEREDILMRALAGQDISRLPKYFLPYDQEAPRLFERQGRALGDGKGELWVDIVSNRAAGRALLDPDTGKPIRSRADDEI